MEKYERIERLRSWGLNVPEYNLVRYRSDMLFLFNAPKGNSYSIRSQPMEILNRESIRLNGLSVIDVGAKLGIIFEKGITPPHAPVVSQAQAVTACGILLSKGFYPLVCDIIDPKNAEWAGAVITEDGYATLEVALGQVMVRKVVSEGKIDERFKFTIDDRKKKYYKCLNVDIPIVSLSQLIEVKYALKKVPKDGFVVELSWYREPVGIKDQKLIFWDGYFFSKEGAESWAR